MDLLSRGFFQLNSVPVLNGLLICETARRYQTEPRHDFQPQSVLPSVTSSWRVVVRIVQVPRGDTRLNVLTSETSLHGQRTEWTRKFSRAPLICPWLVSFRLARSPRLKPALSVFEISGHKNVDRRSKAKFETNEVTVKESSPRCHRLAGAQTRKNM